MRASALADEQGDWNAAGISGKYLQRWEIIPIQQ